MYNGDRGWRSPFVQKHFLMQRSSPVIVHRRQMHRPEQHCSSYEQNEADSRQDSPREWHFLSFRSLSYHNQTLQCRSNKSSPFTCIEPSTAALWWLSITKDIRVVGRGIRRKAIETTSKRRTNKIANTRCWNRTESREDRCNDERLTVGFLFGRVDGHKVLRNEKRTEYEMDRK